MQNLITIKKLHAIVVNANETAQDSKFLVASFNADMMRLGFTMTKALFEALSKHDQPIIMNTHSRVIDALKAMKGDNVTYKPMYPGFPQQVMDASYYELYFNAMCHYWTNGSWLPEYETIQREIGFEDSKLITLDLCSHEDFINVFVKLISSNTSLSEEDKGMVEYYLNNHSEVFTIPAQVPFKETLCLVAAKLMTDGHDITHIITNATDVLRVMTNLSGGDISLAANTKFKSFTRRQRRILVNALERVVNQDDIARHRNKWVRAFHSLHVGEYTACTKTIKIAKLCRNNQSLNTFNSQVEKSLADKNINNALQLLQKRPGDLARRLDHLLRLNGSDAVTEAFRQSADKISTRVLCQLRGHFAGRNNDKRVVFPKGSIAKAVMIPGNEKLKSNVTDVIVNDIDNSLVARFSKLPALGNCWIDPALENCPIPMQQRNASTGLFQVARGTRLPLGSKDTLRLFIYWKGQDIDLSASLHDKNFGLVEHISYTNLKSSKYQACHSGDIVQAPNGAAEFIDINIAQAAKMARYVAMNVFVFRGPNFSEHEICYAGWMMKDQPNKGDIFDPKLVEQKIDLRSDSKNVIPIVFDLETREGIWVDLTCQRGHLGSYFRGNNIENNKASIEDTIKAMTSLANRPNLHWLFSCHAKARGQIVENRASADTIFSLEDGITPFDITQISADYLV